MTATPPDRAEFPAARYDALWAEAVPAVAAGAVALDPWLAVGAAGVAPTPGDPRRGVTLLARPSAATAAALGTFLDQLRALEPAQYYQPAAALHHTVLSLFTATPDYAPYLTHVPEYRAAVAEAVAGVEPFALRVRGVTLSTGAVLAQGFPHGGTLARLRDRLRAALTARALGGTLDRRYRLETAHMTLVRFATPLRDAPGLVAALAAARTREFGTVVVDELELVLGDWYHTAAHERCLARFALTSDAGRAGPPS